MRRLLDSPRVRPVGLLEPQNESRVWLCGSGDPIDVTRNNVIAALRPFTIALTFSRSASPDIRQSGLRLRIQESTVKKRYLGTIHLRFTNTLELPGNHQLFLFEVEGSENRCMPPLNMWLYYLRAKRRAQLQQRRDPFNFRMSPADLRAFDVFYICPRPVVLVTVRHRDVEHIFPMDLIGPTDSPWFTMALRSTSAAVKAMQESKRMALASMPWKLKDVAYDLGKYHKVSNVDWNALPFRTTPSALFALPVPEGFPGVREVEVEEFHQIGSHVLFITTTKHETAAEQNELQLFHQFGPTA